VGGKITIPDFGADGDPGLTDFNDMAATIGKDAVGNAIRCAGAPCAAKAAGVAVANALVVDDRQPINESILPAAELRLLEALRAIPKKAALGKHPGGNVIGWGLCHAERGIDEEVGRFGKVRGPVSGWAGAVSPHFYCTFACIWHRVGFG
jgi:hypothetical protein